MVGYGKEPVVFCSLDCSDTTAHLTIFGFIRGKVVTDLINGDSAVAIADHEICLCRFLLIVIYIQIDPCEPALKLQVDQSFKSPTKVCVCKGVGPLIHQSHVDCVVFLITHLLSALG